MIARVSVIAALMALAGCTGGVDEDALREVSIATDATFPPFHYIDENGEATGFDVELASELVRRAGYEPRVVVVPYDRLFDNLLAGSYQLVAASTGITPERGEKYLFTAPYYDTCQAALVRVGDDEPANLTELAGRRVGAAGAGTSVKALESISGVVPVLLSEGEATEAVIQEDGRVPVLEDSSIDALVVDEMDAVVAAQASNGMLRVLSEPVALEQYGLVLAPDNADLKRVLDQSLENFRQDGSLERLEIKYGLDRGDDWPIDFSR
jgi:ABC-type amino acid transport substrate-binding protein